MMETRNRVMWIVARHGTVALIIIGAVLTLFVGGALGYFYGQRLP